MSNCKEQIAGNPARPTQISNQAPRWQVMKPPPPLYKCLHPESRPCCSCSFTCFSTYLDRYGGTCLMMQVFPGAALNPDIYSKYQKMISFNFSMIDPIGTRLISMLSTWSHLEHKSFESCCPRVFQVLPFLGTFSEGGECTCSTVRFCP